MSILTGLFWRRVITFPFLFPGSSQPLTSQEDSFLVPISQVHGKEGTEPGFGVNVILSGVTTDVRLV